MIKVNGTSYPYQEGKTILDLLKEIKIDLPTLCHDDRFLPASACRTCLVKVSNSSRLLPACRTKLSDNIEIDTHLPEVEDYRKAVLTMLSRRYPVEAVRRNPDKEFHRWLHHYSIVTEIDHDVPDNKIDDSHPYITVDMSRCILCFRCVNICDQVQGQFVWHVVDIADKSRLIFDSRTLFANSPCVSCGACADTCPTGAISDKHALQYGAPEMKVRTVCSYCGVGCEIEVGVRDNRITGIRPEMTAPVNKGHLCVKGRYAWEYTNSKERVIHPMIRTLDEWKVVSWEEAIRYCVKKLTSIQGQYGSDSIAVLGSARATNEENYLIQKFTRAVLGTNNIDCCARVCHQPSAKAMTMAMGTGAATNSFDDIERAKTIMVVGSNATENHPVVGARIKQMALRGANLIVIDPRRIELSDFARYYLAVSPGTNVPLLNAMAQVIVEEKLYDPEFVEQRIEGWAEFKKFILLWTPERAEKICKVSSHLIREAARLYARENPSICFHGLGVTEHVQGTDGVLALINLALLTGNIGKPGTGINPLRGQNNVQGSAAMGCDPSVFTGMASVRNERTRFEGLWNTTLPECKGLNLPEMLESASAGNLKAMWIVGYDVLFTMPNAARTESDFENLDFLIVQDMFMNETARKFADVFLPVANAFEKDGTFMNSERRIQRIRKAISPPADVKTDWEVVRLMAEGVGKNHLFDFSSAEEIWNEIRQAWKAVYGITYDRLDVAGIQWPCPDVNHQGTEILHTETFPIGKKAKLSPIDFKPSPEETSPEYPFILITGRKLYHFNAGTMTYRTPNKELSGSDFLYIHPADAEMIGLSEGNDARLISQYGNTVLPVRLDKAARKGEVFTTFSNDRVFTNKVTSRHNDSNVQTPEYKITAVRIEKVSCPAFL